MTPDEEALNRFGEFVQVGGVRVRHAEMLLDGGTLELSLVNRRGGNLGVWFDCRIGSPTRDRLYLDGILVPLAGPGEAAVERFLSRLWRRPWCVGFVAWGMHAYIQERFDRLRVLRREPPGLCE